MQLRELDPRFKNSTDQGLVLVFSCPKCQKHSLRVPVVVNEKLISAPGHWAITSLDLDNLSMAPSVLHDSGHGCNCHFTVTGGQIVEN